MEEGGNWSDWLQNVGGSLIKSYGQARWSQPYELDRMRIQARADSGYLYDEGTPGAIQQGGISGSVLLIGGAVLLAVVLMKA